MKKLSNVQILLIAIPVIALFNYITGVMANILGIPFFLDTWATSLGVLVVGLPAAAAGGVLYNIVMAATVWGASAWVWSISSIWVALATFYAWKRGWIDIQKPGRVLLAGLMIGLTNAVVTFTINVVAFPGQHVYAGTEPTYAAFLALTGSVNLASFMEHLITEFADKIIAIFMAAIVANSIPKKFFIVKKSK